MIIKNIKSITRAKGEKLTKTANEEILRQLTKHPNYHVKAKAWRKLNDPEYMAVLAFASAFHKLGLYPSEAPSAGTSDLSALFAAVKGLPERWTREHAQTAVDAFKASGMSLADFALAVEVKPRKLSDWQKKLAQ